MLARSTRGPLVTRKVHIDQKKQLKLLVVYNKKTKFREKLTNPRSEFALIEDDFIKCMNS